jgi:hypothetical protein
VSCLGHKHADRSRLHVVSSGTIGGCGQTDQSRLGRGLGNGIADGCIIGLCAWVGEDEVRKAVIESFDGDLVTAERGMEPVKVTVEF